MLELKEKRTDYKLQLDKLSNKEIKPIIKNIKKDFLKNYDLTWLLEQCLNPGNWEVLKLTKGDGFLIKRNDLVWINPTTGQELENYYKYVSKHLPVYLNCYQNWVSQYITEKQYKLKSSENIYFHCHKDNFKGRKKRQSRTISYDEIANCKDNWYSPELRDFLKQGQKVFGIIEDDNLLVGWCYIDSLTKGVAEIYKIEIHPMRRRRGYAIDILSSAMEDIFEGEEHVMFNVEATNIEATSLIQKLGFKEIQREFRFYLYE